MRLSAVLAACALLAGCGGDDRPARARDGRAAFVLDDFFVAPQRLRARPGRLTVEYRNAGRVAHNLVFMRRGRNVRKAETLLPGERGTTELKVSKGNYRIYCSLSNHERLGLYGTLTVR
jgi:plastocyanin